MNDLKKDFALFAKDNNVSSSKLDKFEKQITSQFVHNPLILEERKLNVAALDIYSMMLHDRIIFLNSEVDSDSCNVIIAQLLYLSSLNNQDISLYINSPGGACYDGLSVVSTMDYINCDVSTIVLGMAASMGAVIASNGTKGKRYGLPYSRFMIHQPSSGFRGTFKDEKVHFEELSSVQDDLFNILAKNSGKSFDEIVEMCDRDYWMKTERAIEEGFLDNILVK